jgi:hypothetical protein
MLLIYVLHIVLLIYIILIKSHKRLWLLFFSCANDTTQTDSWALTKNP